MTSGPVTTDFAEDALKIEERPSSRLYTDERTVDDSTGYTLAAAADRHSLTIVNEEASAKLYVGQVVAGVAPKGAVLPGRAVSFTSAAKLAIVMRAETGKTCLVSIIAELH